MVSSFGGALQIIGVRAVIADINKFLSDSKRVEKAIGDQARAADTAKVKSTNAANAQIVKENTLASAVLAAQKKQSAAFDTTRGSIDKLRKARDDLTAAEARAKSTAAAVAKQTPAAEAAKAALGAPGLKKEDKQTAQATINELKRLQKEADAAGKALEGASKRESEALKQVKTDIKAVGDVRAQNARNLENKSIAAERRYNQELRASAAAAKAAENADAKLTAARNVGKKALAIGGAIVGGFVAKEAIGSTISAASKYQDTLSKVDNLTNLTSEDTKTLSKNILELSKTVPQSPNDLGAAAFTATNRGMRDVKEITELLTVAAQAATAGFTDVNTVIQAATGVVNAYGEGNIKAKQAIEILFAAVRAGGADLGDFATDIGRVVQIASTLGIPFTEVAAAVAGLTNVGLQSSQAVTALLGIMNQLFSNDSPKLVEALASVGTSIGQVRQEIDEKGLLIGLQNLLGLFKGNTQILDELLPDVRGASGAFALLGTNFQKNKEIIDQTNKSVGIIDDAFKNVQSNFSVAAGLLKNVFNRALIQLGTEVLPTVTKGIQDLTKWIQDNQDGIAKFGKSVADAAISLTRDFLSSIKEVIDVLGDIKQALADIVGAEAATKAAIVAIGLAFAWAFPGGPVLLGLGLIITALGTLKKTEQERLQARKSELEEELRKSQEITKVNSLGGREVKFGPNILDKLLGRGDVSQADRTAKEQELAEINRKLAESAKSATEAQKENNKETERASQNLKAEAAARDDGAAAAEEAKRAFEELTSEFRSMSEAAGTAASLTADLGMFGEISEELAKFLGISAEVAGAVQGFDAVARAEQRAAGEAFQLTKALATVASAFQKSAAVAQKIVLSLARSALEASQAAAAAVFANPTREVADLNVSLAQNNLSAAKTAASTNPAISALQAQLSAIDRQITAANNQVKQESEAAKNAAKQQKAAQDAAKKAAKAQEDALKNALQAQIDQIKIGNIIARNAYEEINDNLERLLEATNIAQSDLQEQFLKNNEELQRQINEAIGQGDSATALSLVDQQREATKAYREESKALQEHEDQLTLQQRALEREEEARQRAVALQEALLSAQQHQLDASFDHTEATVEDTAATEESTSATNSQVDALEAQKTAIQDQIDKLQSQNDKYDEAGSRIQEQIDIYEAETEVLKANVTAANATLLSQAEQKAKIQELIPMITLESQAVRDLAKLTGTDLIPEMDAARKQFEFIKDAIARLNDPTLTRFEENIDEAALRAGILAGDLNQTTAALNKDQQAVTQHANVVTQAAQTIASGSQSFFNTVKTMLANASIPAAPGPTGVGGGTPYPAFPTVPRMAAGGIVTRPTTIVAGEAGPEAIIPLTAFGAPSLTQATNQAATSLQVMSDAARNTAVVGQEAHQVAIARIDAMAQANTKAAGTTTQLANTTASAAGAIGGLTSAIKGATGAIGSGAPGTMVSGTVGPAGSGGGGGGVYGSGAPSSMTSGSFRRLALGDVIRSPTFALLHANEAVIPLSNPSRARQIISQIPPQIWANIMGRRQAQAVFSPNITVTGETLDSMEAAAIRAVQRAFRDARVGSSRSGGLISQGLGPNS